MSDEKDNSGAMCVALIPARAGSKRIPNKNIKMLAGHPLIAYTVRAAIDSGIFSRVIVSTNSKEIAEIAKNYGAEIPFMRPAKYAEPTSPDIEFVLHALRELKRRGKLEECFSILRPTSPLRQPETIKRAWGEFLKDSKADSIRAVEKCAQHPAKMWKVDGNRMKPILENPDKNDTPWHSKQYPSLPEIYVQNASLEIAWSRVPLEGGTIAGDEIIPFVTEGYEGFDINVPTDWMFLKHLLLSNVVTLPHVKKQ